MRPIFEIKEQEFWIGGRKELVLCGEIHYFRMPRESWDKALDALVEAGCNMVAYYVPWFVHEYQEGQFDFTGTHHPSNNLVEWIQLTIQKGLLGFLRPGPYIYAECTNLGIPEWFIQKYPNAQVKKYEDGQYKNFSRIQGVGHNHPQFLRSVAEWYKQVCRIFKPYLAPQGNVVLVQLCNEIPTDDHDDRNPENLGIGDAGGLYPQYLLKKYKTLQNLKNNYLLEVSSFAQVEPHMLEQANPALAKLERLEFYYTCYYPAYFQTLRNMMLANDVESTFIHNAYNPRAVSLHNHNRIKNPWLHVGLDSYYSLTGNLSPKSLTYFCEFGAEYSREFLRDVPFVIEQECGYWHDYPVVYGPELYIWNIWSIAAGYRGFNMYLFAGGINRQGMGFYGTNHNWQAPVDELGNKKDSYVHIQKSLQFIQQSRDILVLPNKYDIALGIKADPGLIWKDVSAPSCETYFALRSEGYTPQILDFASDASKLDVPALVVVSDDHMDEETQAKLLQYVQHGGKLYLCGRVPTKAMNLAGCTLLADALHLQLEGFINENADQEIIRIKGYEYAVGAPLQAIHYPSSAKIIGTARDGSPAVGCVTLGRGSVTIIPFYMQVLLQNACRLLAHLLQDNGFAPNIAGAAKSKAFIKSDGSVILLNLHPIAIQETILAGNEAIDVDLPPYSVGIQKKRVVQ